MSPMIILAALLLRHLLCNANSTLLTNHAETDQLLRKLGNEVALKVQETLAIYKNCLNVANSTLNTQHHAFQMSLLMSRYLVKKKIWTGNINELVALLQNKMNGHLAKLKQIEFYLPYKECQEQFTEAHKVKVIPAIKNIEEELKKLQEKKIRDLLDFDIKQAKSLSKKWVEEINKILSKDKKERKQNKVKANDKQPLLPNDLYEDEDYEVLHDVEEGHYENLPGYKVLSDGSGSLDDTNA
eukprot:GAHX01001335.1.p1 GENE.GAHX01001335.1~~GAHX01001335.1.p1  ORF type:complete len:241 (+),score=46.25 GAHX01001335.1:199-921(+)